MARTKRIAYTAELEDCQFLKPSVVTFKAVVVGSTNPYPSFLSWLLLSVVIYNAVPTAIPSIPKFQSRKFPSISKFH